MSPGCPVLSAARAAAPILTRTRYCLDAAGGEGNRGDIQTTEGEFARVRVALCVYPSKHLTCKLRRHWLTSDVTSLRRHRDSEAFACQPQRHS